jgi:Fe-S-cluster-containing hydrogenase component 2
MDKHQILIDYEKCKPCKKCVMACYVDVIVWDAANKKPVAKYPEECAPIPEPYPRAYYPKSYVKE